MYPYQIGGAKQLRCSVGISVLGHVCTNTESSGPQIYGSTLFKRYVRMEGYLSSHLYVL